MSAHPTPAKKDHGSFLLNNPAISATVITLIITGVFIGALAREATGHHGGSTHEAASGHGAASGAPRASGAPATPGSAGGASTVRAPH